MLIRIPNIKQALSCADDALVLSVAKQCRISPDSISELRILRQSVDARKKSDIFLATEVEFDCDKRIAVRLLDDKTINAELVKAVASPPPSPGNETRRGRIIVVGLGPGGLFAGYLLAKAGYSPLIVERGMPMDRRVIDVERYWNSGVLDPNSNVAFGEGGAGTFSDGKLTTRIKDVRVRDVIKCLVKFGAPSEIAVMAKPHIGTDNLRKIIPALRGEIERLGGEIRFNTCLTDIFTRDGSLVAVELTHNGCVKKEDCAALVPAIGQAARDTCKMLQGRGVRFSPKAFALGVRVEHPQAWIDKAQYGDLAGHPRLGAAEYRVSGQGNGRGVYSFCMCPGGQVVAAASGADQVAVNGMSNHARDGKNANAALVVQVNTTDFGDDPMSGMAFCEKWEHESFLAGGASGLAPAQRVADFMERRRGAGFGTVAPSYRPCVLSANLWDCIPLFAAQALFEALPQFGRQIRAEGRSFDMDDAVLTAVESRTSAPLRMDRGGDGQSLTVKNVYPVGEGAGYAGGIVSAAVDGLCAAERIISRFAL